MIWRTALFVSLSLVSSQAHAFFPSAPVNPPVAAVARSSVVAGGGGGGGGTPLLFAYNSGKFKQNSGTSLNVTFPDGFFSTNSVVTLGILTGGTTISHVKDNRGNLWVRDSTATFSGAVTMGIYHFVATNTYLGVYNATITINTAQTIVAGFIVSSNTNSSVALDVSTNSSGTGAVVYLGTTTATNANTGICMSAFADNSGVNDSKTWQGPYTLVAAELDGTSFITGSIGFSTGSATVPINSAAQKGNCTLAASKTWQSITGCFKSP